MYKLLVTILLSIQLIGCVDNKNVNTPPNWRVADKEDAIDDWARFDSPNKIINDFNGDGKKDIAQILVSSDSEKGYNFVVEIGERQFLLESNNEITPQSVAIELIKPSNSTFESACAKGYWECEANEIRQFKITKPSIQFCYIESACSIFIWSERKNDFIRIPISD